MDSRTLLILSAVGKLKNKIELKKHQNIQYDFKNGTETIVYEASFYKWCF
mgnify:CR=1 FL=1